MFKDLQSAGFNHRLHLTDLADLQQTVIPDLPLSEVGDRCLNEAFSVRVIIDVVGSYQLAVGSNHRAGVSDVVITEALSQNSGVGPRNPMVF